MIDHYGHVDLVCHCSDCGKKMQTHDYYHRVGNEIYCIDCDYKRAGRNMVVES